jgi:hypothetical protein
MDNEYAFATVVYERLREARAEAERNQVIVEHRRRRRTIRGRLGAALISLGQRLALQSLPPNDGVRPSCLNVHAVPNTRPTVMLLQRGRIR